MISLRSGCPTGLFDRFGRAVDQSEYVSALAHRTPLDRLIQSVGEIQALISPGSDSVPSGPWFLSLT